MEYKKGSCCNNKNCTCPPNDCRCVNCKCGDSECPGCQQTESYEYSKTTHYSKTNDKEDYSGEEIKRHRVNDNMEEQIIREKELPGGKILVTKQIRKGNELKKIDQYVREPGNQPSIQ